MHTAGVMIVAASDAGVGVEDCAGCGHALGRLAKAGSLLGAPVAGNEVEAGGHCNDDAVSVHWLR